MARVWVILLALVLDLKFGDPPNRFHPLMLMGRWLGWGRRLAPARCRFCFGTIWTLLGIALFALPWIPLERCDLSGQAPAKQSRFRLSWLFLLIRPLFLKSLFAYRNLRRALLEVADALAADDLVEARRLLGWHLVSRKTADLTEAEVAGAAIESLAENLTDSLVAPLLAYAAGGLPAAWAYRFVNTADAMWGYRTAEFEQLGKFPARLDDALNWLPARLTGWLLVLAAGLTGENARRAARTMLDQHGQTTSPNAGWTMSAVAGALGVTLSKRNTYDLVGGPARPDLDATRRALYLADAAAGLAVVVAMLTALAASGRK